MKKQFIILPFLFCIILIACNEIFEYNLEKEKVIIISPADSVKTIVMSQTFLWEKVPEATSYQMQIVSPSFASSQQMIIDTTVENNIFYHTFFPGQYQWRVRAMNNSSQTDFSTYTITIDTTSNLSQQFVVLLAPGNNTYSNSLGFNLSWQNLTAATSYNFQIASGSFPNILLDTTISSNNLFYIINSEGPFQWKVRALNGFSSSQFSTAFVFTSDTTRPSAPVLTFPSNGAVISTQPFSFSWNRDASTQLSELIGDSLFIFSDTINTLLKPVVFCETTTYSDSLVSGTYYWKVKSMDKAGNISFGSALRKLVIN